METWMEMRLSPRGGGLWFGDTLRCYAAQTLDGVPGTNRLFWRDPQGQTLPGSPTIVFFGARRFVGVRVLHRDGLDTPQAQADLSLAGACMLRIAQRLDDDFGGFHDITYIRGDHTLTPGWGVYTVRHLALPRNRMPGTADFDAVMDGVRSGTGAPDADLVRSLIVSGLREMFPGSLLAGAVRMLEAPAWGTPVKVGTAVRLVVRNVVFGLPLKIRGPVMVGGLRSRGFGDVRRA